MASKDYLRKDNKPIWCTGCGLYILLNQIVKIFDELKFEPIILSGIGCTGRSAGYFNLDSVHGLHGRVIPLAEGVKISRDDKEVMVISGDGDILGIGGNHFIHASRRDVDMVVICVNNGVYGLTGGQLSPTTKKGMKTTTTPQGSEIEPINAQKILMANKKYFYARTTPIHTDHLNKVIKEAIEWKGFAFVEVVTICLETLGKHMNLREPVKMYKWLKDNYKIVEGKDELDEFDLGVVKHD